MLAKWSRCYSSQLSDTGSNPARFGLHFFPHHHNFFSPLFCAQTIVAHPSPLRTMNYLPSVVKYPLPNSMEVCNNCSTAMYYGDGTFKFADPLPFRFWAERFYHLWPNIGGSVLN